MPTSLVSTEPNWELMNNEQQKQCCQVSVIYSAEAHLHKTQPNALNWKYQQANLLHFYLLPPSRAVDLLSLHMLV